MYAGVGGLFERSAGSTADSITSALSSGQTGPTYSGAQTGVGTAALPPTGGAGQGGSGSLSPFSTAGYGQTPGGGLVPDSGTGSTPAAGMGALGSTTNALAGASPLAQFLFGTPQDQTAQQPTIGTTGSTSQSLSDQVRSQQAGPTAGPGATGQGEIPGPSISSGVQENGLQVGQTASGEGLPFGWEPSITSAFAPTTPSAGPPGLAAPGTSSISPGINTVLGTLQALDAASRGNVPGAVGGTLGSAGGILGLLKANPTWASNLGLSNQTLGELSGGLGAAGGLVGLGSNISQGNVPGAVGSGLQTTQQLARLLGSLPAEQLNNLGLGDLAGVPLGLIGSGAGALSGGLGLYQGIQNGSPLQSILGGTQFYNDAVPVINAAIQAGGGGADYLPSLTSLASRGIDAISSALGVGGAAASGALTGLGAGVEGLSTAVPAAIQGATSAEEALSAGGAAAGGAASEAAGALSGAAGAVMLPIALTGIIAQLFGTPGIDPISGIAEAFGSEKAGTSKQTTAFRTQAAQMNDLYSADIQNALSQYAGAQGVTDPTQLRAIGDALMGGLTQYYRTGSLGQGASSYQSPTAQAFASQANNQAMSDWLGLNQYLLSQGQPGLTVDPTMAQAVGIAPPGGGLGPYPGAPTTTFGNMATIDTNSPLYQPWLNQAFRGYEQAGGMGITPWGTLGPVQIPDVLQPAPAPLPPIYPEPDWNMANFSGAP